MKKICQLMLVLFVLSSLTVHAQVKPSTLVTLEVKDKTIPEVLDILNKKLRLRYMFNRHDFETLPKVTLNEKEQPLETVLGDLFRPFNISWTLDNGVLLLKKMAAPDGNAPASIVTITGTVSDEQGQPLALATVGVESTTFRTSTDAKGDFKIQAAPDAVLSVSYIGHKTTRIPVKNRTVIHITMGANANQLEDVVVNTGFAQVNARDLTGAVTTIKGKDIDVPGLHTVDQMLEGHVPGMTFLQNSGQAGAAPKVQIRGTSTILGNQEPLWVIDGIVQQDPIHIDPSQLNNLDFTNLLGNAVSGLNPDDIEQIDVLKDAAATAIYGVRAANGVIVITTKRGKKGPPVISYGVSGTLTRRPHYTDGNINVMNSLERTGLSRDLIAQGINYPRVTEWIGYEGAYLDYVDKKIDLTQFQQEVGRFETVNTDWFKMLMHDATSDKHTLSISGGDGNVNYYTSVGVDQNNGVIKGEHSNLYSILSKISTNYKRLTVDVGLSANTQRRQYDVNNASDYAYKTSRVLPLYNEDGSLYYYDRSSGYNGNTLYPFNIVNEENNSYQKGSVDGIALNSTLGYRILDNLHLGVTLGYQLDNSNQSVWHDYNSYYSAVLRQQQPDGTISPYSSMPYGGELQETNQRREAYTVRPQLDFHGYIGGGRQHQIIATAGAEVNSNHYTGKAQTIRGYLPDRGGQTASFDITQYPTYEAFLETPAASGVHTDDLTRLASTYGSVTYNYDDRYLLNVNARIDGSNKFGSQSNDKLNPIWSVSGRWNVKEDLLQHSRWVDALSLRGSFGFQGDIADNQTPELIIERSPSTTPSGEFYSTIVSFPNPFLRWEKTASYNVQTDFGLFGNKVRGVIAYWYKHTSDAFLLKNVSDINGVTAYYVNEGTLDNHGLELTLSFTPVDRLSHTSTGVKGFRWTFDPQLGSVINQFINKAIQTSNNTTQTNYTYFDYINGNVPTAGHPLNTIWAYQYSGLDPANGTPTFAKTDVKYKDTYDNMSQQDVWTTVLKPVGSRVPVVQGGLINNFQYNRFYLTVNFTYSLGSKIRLSRLYPNFDASQGTNAPLPNQNARRELLQRWQKPGDETHTNIPSIVGGDVFNAGVSPWWNSTTYAFGTDLWSMYDYSDLRVVSGDFLKLQSFSFRYQLPDEWNKRLNMKSAFVGLSGTNVFVWSSRALHGQDPATATGTGAIPLSLRPSFSFSLNVSF